MRENTILLDDTDWRILEILQENARATFTEIGLSVGLTSPAVRERIRRMEEVGLITGYRPVISYGVLGRQIRALIALKFKSGSRAAQSPEFSPLEPLSDIPGVVRAWLVTGDTECFVEAAVPTMKALDGILVKLHDFGFLTVTYMILDDTGEKRCRQL
ncbi:MAG: Lrp/AsnC family transcriptional regulator [Synergistaceae bacterium]|nr:Lrp/AsnC family transcriptional regulator [Synergistaceae bacterium]